MDFQIPSKYQQDINNAVNLLKDEGCKSVYLFGSLVTGNLHENSDLDFGVMGLCPRKYFQTCTKLYKVLENDFDLIDFDENIGLFKMLLSIDEVVKIG